MLFKYLKSVDSDFKKLFSENIVFRWVIMVLMFWFVVDTFFALLSGGR